jgi:hypothetical protein
MHVDRDYGGALLDGQSHQCPLHRDRRLDLRRAIGHRVDVIKHDGGATLVAAQAVQAGIDHDAIQPAADGGVVAKSSGAAVRREHRVLQGILRILGAAAGEPGKPVQLSVMTVEQLLEGIAVTRDVGGQQFGIASLFSKVLPNLPPEAHRRTVTNPTMPGTSPDPK